MLYPYAISRESVNGHRVWIAKSLHLKGCVAQGDTRLEAIKELESNEIAWLETAKYCISLSQINTHTTENSYSIYTLAVRRSFLCNLFLCYKNQIFDIYKCRWLIWTIVTGII